MSPGMGPGNMGSGGMGPGMMGGNGQPSKNSGTSFPTATPGGSSEVSFRQNVQPILDQNCIKCHGGEGGLYLDSYDHVIAGGANGAVVIAGDPALSELVERIEGTSQPRMPLDAPPLPSSEINIIVTWVKEGAPNN
jgi:mono/diheme cytochrome c family protein